MDIDEVEDFYNKEVEKLDREFIEELKKGTKKSLLEDTYKKRLLSIKAKYEKEYNRFLRTHKDSILEKTKPSEEKEKKKKSKKRFVVTHLKLSLSRKERMSMRWELFKFGFRIKLKNFFYSITPNFIVVHKIRMKFLIRKMFRSTREYISKTLSSIKKLFLDMLSGIKSVSLKIFSWSKDKALKLYKKISAKLSKKKKTEKSGEKSEDAKIADKLLAKSK